MTSGLQYHNLGRDHGKLKAAHLKVCDQLKQQTAQLEEVSHEKEQAVRENINMAESLAVERVKLQTQTAQFTKLVDYQHTPLRASYRKVSEYAASWLAKVPCQYTAEHEKKDKRSRERVGRMEQAEENESA